VDPRIELTLPLAPGGSVSGLWATPPGEQSPWTVVYAPGAGSNLHDPFGGFLAEHLAALGIPSLRFQFPYQESESAQPDRPPVLEAAWDAAIATAAARGGRLVLTGRSMGGRIASMVVATGAPAAALGLFAYPLHPPGRPQQRRDGHLAAITIPTLFCSGTRDAFATADELAVAAALVPRSSVHLLEGADHGFAVLKSSGRTRPQVWAEAAQALTDWLVSLR